MTEPGEEQQEKYNKWKDPEFLRVYYRHRRRNERGGLKRHPNLTEDNQRWLDVNPQPVKKYTYEHKTCDVCGRTYKFINAHTKTKFHQEVQTLLSKSEQKLF